MDQIMQGIFDWFTSTFSSSGSKALENSMVNLQTVPNPDLGAVWYQNLWVINFAFAVLLGLLAAIVNMVIAARKQQLYGFVQAIADFGLVVFVGYLLLTALYGIMLAVDGGSQLIILVTTGSTDPSWYTGLVTIKNATDVQGAFALNAFSWASGNILLLQTFVIRQMIYIFAILFVLTLCFYRNKVGSQFFRWVKAGLIASVITKLLVIVWLAIASKVMAAMALTGTDALSGVAIVMFIAMLIGLITFFSLALRKKQEVEVKGTVQTEGSTTPVNGGSSLGTTAGLTAASVAASSRPSSAPQMKEPLSVQQKALSAQSKAKKVALISTGVNTAAKVAGPKLVSVATGINPGIGAAAAAVVGGTILATDKISSNANKVVQHSGTVATYGEHVDDLRAWNRNRKSKRSTTA